MIFITIERVIFEMPTDYQRHEDFLKADNYMDWTLASETSTAYIYERKTRVWV